MGTGFWLRLEPLILRDFMDNTFFYKHPNVQKANSSEHALIHDFKSKLLEFMEFYGINKMDFLELKRFFEMYIGAWADEDFFWNVTTRVFNVKCTSFRKLSKMRSITQGYNPDMSKVSIGKSSYDQSESQVEVVKLTPFNNRVNSNSNFDFMNETKNSAFPGAKKDTKNDTHVALANVRMAIEDVGMTGVLELKRLLVGKIEYKQDAYENSRHRSRSRGRRNKGRKLFIYKYFVIICMC
jgi:hypothetical protein